MFHPGFCPWFWPCATRQGLGKAYGKAYGGLRIGMRLACALLVAGACAVRAQFTPEKYEEFVTTLYEQTAGRSGAMGATLNFAEVCPSHES